MSELLLPAENMALTVARAQVQRGENPTPNVTAVLVMALDRLIDFQVSDPDPLPLCETCKHTVSKHRRVGVTAFCMTYACGCTIVHLAATMLHAPDYEDPGVS